MSETDPFDNLIESGDSADLDAEVTPIEEIRDMLINYPEEMEEILTGLLDQIDIMKTDLQVNKANIDKLASDSSKLINTDKNLGTNQRHIIENNAELIQSMKTMQFLGGINLAITFIAIITILGVVINLNSVPESVETLTPTSTYTLTSTETFTNTPIPTETETPTLTSTNTPTVKATSTETPTATSTNTLTPTDTFTPTATSTKETPTVDSTFELDFRIRSMTLTPFPTATEQRGFEPTATQQPPEGR